MRRIVLPGAVMGGLIMASTASPAVAAPVPPSGCQFVGGVTSCSSAVTASAFAPLQVGQGTVGLSNDGTGAGLVCLGQGATSYRLETLFVAVLVTTRTTTTTSHRGAPNSSGIPLPTRVEETTNAAVFAGQVSCF